jgi:hypothetical protein
MTDLEWLLWDRCEKVYVDEIFPTRTGNVHCCMKLGKDLDHVRKNLPKVITDYAQTQGIHIPEKMQITWINCYLYNNFPDQTKDDWENFDCSHRCVSWGIPEGYQCIYPYCLIWESKSNNHSRGYMKNICSKKCNHCSEYLCHCQNLHSPCCI